MTPYITISDANTYLANRMGSNGWDTATTEQRNKALGHATRIINQLPIGGTKTDSEQENEFPRNPDVEVPTNVKYACVEIALALLDGVDIEEEYKDALFSSVKHASLTTVKDPNNCPEHISYGVPSIIAWRLIRPYLRDPRSINLARS